MIKPLRYICLILSLSAAPAVCIAQTEAFPYTQEQLEQIKRFPAAMPPNLSHSGYCCLLYDVDKTGKPKNVQTPYCTDEVFSTPSKTALSKWRYPIALKKGKAVTVKKLTNFMSYRITDDAGVYIPSPQGFLARLKPNEKIPPQPKNFPDAYYWAEDHFNLEKPCGEPIA